MTHDPQEKEREKNKNRTGEERESLSHQKASNTQHGNTYAAHTSAAQLRQPRPQIRMDTVCVCA